MRRRNFYHKSQTSRGKSTAGKPRPAPKSKVCLDMSSTLNTVSLNFQPALPSSLESLPFETWDKGKAKTNPSKCACSAQSGVLLRFEGLSQAMSGCVGTSTNDNAWTVFFLTGFLCAGLWAELERQLAAKQKQLNHLQTAQVDFFRERLGLRFDRTSDGGVTPELISVQYSLFFLILF